MDDIKQSVEENYYSLLLDESLDISDTKYLGIAIIYFDCLKKKSFDIPCSNNFRRL